MTEWREVIVLASIDGDRNHDTSTARPAAVTHGRVNISCKVLASSVWRKEAKSGATASAAAVGIAIGTAAAAVNRRVASSTAAIPS
jgi:hypothetical protein